MGLDGEKKAVKFCNPKNSPYLCIIIHINNYIMQRTFIDIVSECNEPWVELAKEAYFNQGGKIDDASFHDLRDALFSGFFWDQTPQGQEYWRDITKNVMASISPSTPQN